MSDGLERCEWCGEDALYVRYHDTEWGVPVHDDRALFELLTLEGAQAGLSWLTVLRRREGYRLAFEHFDPDIVSRYDDERVEAIMGDAGVIRHRQKIESVLTNARAIVEIQRSKGLFDTYIWNLGRATGDRLSTGQSMSAQLRKDGFKFVGPTICRSFMQASGMVNDHAPECFRYREIEALQ